MKNLLWVEDDFYDLKPFGLPIEKSGVSIEPATSYSQAIEQINNKEYDRYIIDLILPKGEGVEEEGNVDELYGIKLIKMIREKSNSVPIHVFTIVYDDTVDDILSDYNIYEKFQKGYMSNEIFKESVLASLSE